MTTALGSLDVTRILVGFWKTNALPRLGYYIALPLILGAASVFFEWRVHDLGPVQTGLFFFAGIMFNVVMRIWSWTADLAALAAETPPETITHSVIRDRIEVRRDQLERLRDTTAYATLASLLLAVLVVAMGATTSQSATGGEGVHWPTVALAIAGTHLVVVLIAAVNRAVIAAETSIEEIRRLLAQAA